MLKQMMLGAALCSAVLLSSCGSDSTITADDMSGVLNKVDEGVIAVGYGLSAAAARSVDDICDEHASVKSTAAVSGNAVYPGLVHYCLIAKNTYSPDSIQGAYALLKSISCALKAAGGVTFDGAAKSMTVSLTTDCFRQSQIDEIGTSLSTTVTGSTSPSFAPHYSHGVEISIPAASMTFKFATKVTGNLVEFASMETGQGEGAFQGAFDSSTGEVWYEARMDRFDATCSRKDRDCGWSRHIRLYADTEGTGTTATVQTYSGIYSDVQKSTFSGRVMTAHGTRAEGLYVREFSNSGGTRAQLADPTHSNWVLANSTGACIDIGAASTCTSNTGLNVKSAAANGNFFMIPTNTTYTTAASFLTAATGLTFTTAAFTDTP